MADLASFIRARLDEDEAMANAAAKYHSWSDNPWYSGEIHIARHDPARVLRQVTAMRAILDAHDRPEHYCPIPVVHGRHGQLWTPAEGPCWTLRSLAAIWSDHDDYASAMGTTPDHRSAPVPDDEDHLPSPW